jgi:hypothetical protein
MIEGLRKTGIAGVPTEMRTEHLPNKVWSVNTRPVRFVYRVQKVGMRLTAFRLTYIKM